MLCHPSCSPKKTALKPKASEFRLGQLAQSELKASLASLHAESRVPGVGVGIVFGRQVVWTGVFSYAELENKMTADSVTRIGSLSKIFTGLAILSLRDQGRLDLDMPVAKVVPELAQSFTHRRTVHAFVQTFAHTYIGAAASGCS